MADSGFTLDTSGAVPRPPTQDGHADGWWYWSDLTPVRQGYVEALFASLRRWHPEHSPVLPVPGPEGSSSVVMKVGFSDLSPEALETILADCAAITTKFPSSTGYTDGQRAWELRQSGEWDAPPPWCAIYLPRLTVSIGDDGKVLLS